MLHKSQFLDKKSIQNNFLAEKGIVMVRIVHNNKRILRFFEGKVVHQCAEVVVYRTDL